MSVADHASLTSLAQRLNLVTEDQVRECLFELETPNPSPEEMLRILERKGYITPWQASKLKKGDTDGYFLGGFRLLYKISAGTFGRVYRGDDPRTGEVVAIKVLRRRWTENPQKIDLFEREGKMGMAIRHPNIVSILAVSKDPKSGQYFIVMEFVEGGNLKDILNIRKKLSPDESLKILDETVTGLAHAFSMGMTHRDIKPTNILVSASKVCKLVDFGLAELTSTATKLSWGEEDQDLEIDQSIDYAGLEQATGCKPGDIRSDIYFLGCVLFHMLTGAPLLTMTKDVRARKDRKRFDIIGQIDRKHPDIPPLVFALLAKMIAFDANDRFQTPLQLQEAIRNVRAELGHAVSGTAPAATAQKTVFVVEHHPKLQDTFREKLKERGFRVLISIDADRALQRFKQQPFHALVVDVGTAGEEGLESFCKVMREVDKMHLKCLGVLIFNEDQVHLKARAPEYGEITCLVRPVNLKQLYRALGAEE